MKTIKIQISVTSQTALWPCFRDLSNLSCFRCTCVTYISFVAKQKVKGSQSLISWPSWPDLKVSMPEPEYCSAFIKFYKRQWDFFALFYLEFVPDVPLEPMAAVNETMWKMTVCNTSFLSLIRTRGQVEPMTHVWSISIFLVGLKWVIQYKLFFKKWILTSQCFGQHFVSGLGSSLESTW